jgi:hypothetical protein
LRGGFKGSSVSCLRQTSHVSPSQLQILRPRFSSHLRTSNYNLDENKVAQNPPSSHFGRTFMMSDAQPSPNHAHRDHLRERVRLRRKRKTTSCWPCRDRKVKCDKSLPCDTCVKRDYPDLCSYASPSSHHASANARPAAQAGGNPSCTPKSSGIESPSLGNREPFLGENAIPSFARDQTSPINGASTRDNVQAGFMPIIGHNTEPADDFLPVMADVANILDGLPLDRDIIK